MDALSSLTSSIQSILGTSTNPFMPSAQEIPYNAADYTVPNIAPMLQQAYQALAPYYQQILTQSQNDENLAIQYLQQDTDLTLRQAAQAQATTDVQQMQDLQSALEQLTGVTDPQEQATLLDTLNKRGIATTENQQGGLSVGTAGEAGQEVGQQTDAEQLRQEATTRAAQRAVQQAATTYQNTADTAAQSQKEKTSSIQQGEQQTAENLSQQMQQNTMNMASQEQQTALAQEQMNINKEQNAKVLGAAGLSTGTTGSNSFSRESNTGTLNGTSYNDVNKWLAAGGSAANLT